MEKYISSEDEKKAEEDAKLEEARKLAEMVSGCPSQY